MPIVLKTKFLIKQKIIRELYMMKLSCYISILYCFLCLQSCIPGPLIVTTSDVSNNSDLWYGYSCNSIYKLNEDVFIKIIDLPLPNKIVLVAPRDKTKGVHTLHYGAPSNIKEYQDKSDKWKNIIGIIESSTKLKCFKLIKYNPFGYPSSLYIYARILDGPYAGYETEISDLSLLGPEHKFGYLMKPNPNLLSLIENKANIDN